MNKKLKLGLVTGIVAGIGAGVGALMKKRKKNKMFEIAVKRNIDTEKILDGFNQVYYPKGDRRLVLLDMTDSESYPCDVSEDALELIKDVNDILVKRELIDITKEVLAVINTGEN